MCMTEEQRGQVVKMNAWQAYLAWHDLHEARPDFPPPPPVADPKNHHDYPPAAMFLGVVDDAGLDQADLILPMCRRTHPEAVAALEIMMGHPITRVQPRGKAAPRSGPRVRTSGPRLSVSSSDTRTIVSVVPNPKKPGSASYERFALYKEGMKVMDAIAAGVTPGDIRWDTDRGFIKLGA